MTFVFPEIPKGPWGVWNTLSRKWCCLEPGYEDTDVPYSSTHERAKEVYDYMSMRFMGGVYQLRLYEKGVK